MSGQPNRYAADAAKFRQDYMNALDLRSSLDDQVLQAVKVYKQTGQVPAISSMPDNRTAEEKLKDTEGLKMSIIAEMKPIGSSQFAQEVIQRIMRSPLNSDGSFFTFFAQRVSGIVKTLKDSYAVGIKGDSNDVERLVSSVEDLYSKDKAMATTTKSYFDRPSNAPGGIGVGDLTLLKQQYDMIIPKILAKIPVNQVNTRAIVNDINIVLLRLSGLLNSDRYKLFTQRVADLSVPPPGALGIRPDQLQDLYNAYNLYNGMIALLPSYSKINALFLQLEKSITNADNALTSRILTTILEQFPSITIVDGVDNAIRTFIASIQRGNPGPPMGGYVPQPLQAAAEERILGPRPPEVIIQQRAGHRPSYLVPPPLGGGQAALTAWANAELVNEPLAYPGGPPVRSASQILYTVPGITRDVGGMAAYAALRMAGQGIHPEKRRRGRPKGCGIKVPFAEKVDSSQGVQASPRYISFGKHVINKKKLGDGILSIRTKSGANIASSPVRHISQNMKIVVDKIIGGAIPSYEELSKLTEEEKSYLHRVSKQADILDKFSIPAPSKDQEEKEIHEYEVMRGEIMSGNDNKELIKKFKLLIIKLSRRGALPKKEVTDILSELIELGY